MRTPAQNQNDPINDASAHSAPELTRTNISVQYRVTPGYNTPVNRTVPRRHACQLLCRGTCAIKVSTVVSIRWYKMGNVSVVLIVVLMCVGACSSTDEGKSLSTRCVYVIAN